MPSQYEKCFVFFSFFTLLFCSQTISAQDENPQQPSIVELNSLTPKIENPAAEIETFSQTISIDSDAVLNDENNRQSDAPQKPITKKFKYNFHSIESSENLLEFQNAASGNIKKFSFPPEFTLANLPADANDEPAAGVKAENFQWRAAIGQSLMFLAVQHGYAFTQLKTREALKGKFWKDYTQSVKNLRGWDDGGRFFTNYIAHPMQGALTGHIYVQNDPKARKQQFGISGDYWRSRTKAMLWTTAWSTQFEIGLISQASIGNIGLTGKQTWEDIIVTPTLGTAMLIGEDAIDRFIIKNIERRISNFYVKVFSRMLLNPTRNFSNMLRFKEPWYRDRPNAR